MSEFGCRCLGIAAGAAARGWKPFPLPGAPKRWSRDRQVDVTHIRLDLQIDPRVGESENGLIGVVTHTVVPFLDGLTELVLDCAELTVTRCVVGRKKAKFTLEDGRLTITLPSKARRGRPLNVAVEDEGAPRRGLYFIRPDEDRPDVRNEVWSQGQDEDSRHWFPCFDYPNEKQTSEMSVTVPSGFRVLSNGSLVGKPKRHRDKKTTFHWRFDHQHVTYLMMVAVGDYEVHETSWRKVPVTYWSPPGRMADVKRTLGRTPRMMTLFSKLTGYDYPYPQYAQVFVQDFIFGGMENTSATTLTDTAIIDASAAPETWMDGLVAHELAHQWFGDLVTCRDWSHGWLNEGFASFLETVWKRAADGLEEEAYYRMGQHAAYLAEDGGSYRRPIVCKEYIEPIEIFDRHLYQKGASVLHMLADHLGEDLFWECVSHYLKQHAYGSVVTDDLRRAIEDVTGRNLEWFFDQWVHHGGHPVLRVTAKREKKGLAITVEQTQKTDDMTPLFRFDVDVRVQTAKGAVERRLEIREARQTFHLEPKGKVGWVAFDPGAHVLWAGEVKQSPEAWAKALVSDPDAATRVRAARALAKVASPAATDALAAGLSEDALWFVRAECAKGLAGIATKAARDALLAETQQEDPRVRRVVASALGAFRHDEVAAEGILEMLGMSEPSPGVLHDAAIALGKTRVEEAGETLVDLFDRISWNDMAWRGALTGLGELRDDEYVDHVLACTGPTCPDSVRAAATSALTHLGRDDDDVRERLEELVDDRWLRVQVCAALALAERREEKSVPVLRRAAQRAIDGRVMRTCRVAADTIATGRGRDEELRKLRAQLEELRAEVTKLQDS
jgi:aminopeptidase N